MTTSEKEDVDIGLLTSSFLAGRHLFRVKNSDNVFDYPTVIETLEQHGVENIDRPEIIAPEDAGRILDVEEPFETNVDAPDGVGYYLFGERNRALSSPQIELYEFVDVTMVFRATSAGRPEIYLFDSNRRLINILFFGANARYREAETTLSGTTIFAEDFFVQPNICHLLFDKWPRSHWAARHAPEARHALFHPHRYATDFYAAMGLELISLLHHAPGGSIHFERLVISANSFGAMRHPGQSGCRFAKDALRALREKLGIAGRKGGAKMLMLDRQSADKRAVVNWSHYMTCLGAAGVEAYDPAAFSFAEQVATLSDCRLLIGVHGAGLTNLVYMPEDSAIIEILPPWSATSSFWHGAELVNRRYEAVVALDAAGHEHDQNTMERDRSQHRNNVTINDEQIDRIIALSKTL